MRKKNYKLLISFKQFQELYYHTSWKNISLSKNSKKFSENQNFITIYQEFWRIIKINLFVTDKCQLFKKAADILYRVTNSSLGV